MTNKRNEKQKIYNIPGERKNSPSASFVDISAERTHFFMKFYLTVKQSNIHFTPSLVQVYWTRKRGNCKCIGT